MLYVFMPINSADAQEVLRKIFQNIRSICNNCLGQSVTGLSSTVLYDSLSRINEQFKRYANRFDKYFDLIPPFKQPLYLRQRALLVRKCRATVEHLGFDFETDFEFAFDLEDESEEPIFDHYLTRVRVSRSADLSIRRVPSSSELNASSVLDIANRSTDGVSLVRVASLPDLKFDFTRMSRNAQTQTMTTFDIKTANQLIPDFDGNHKTLVDFLDKIEFYQSTLDGTGKVLLLRFVMMTKLSQKVKDRYSVAVTNDYTFDIFKENLLSRFTDKTTKEAKMDQIERLYQKGTVAEFATKLETLCADLVRLKMIDRATGERSFVQKEVDELAVRVLTRGLQRSEVRQALIYKEPRTLADAIKFALEADAKFLREVDRFPVSAFSHQGQDNHDQSRNNSNNNRGRNRNNQYNNQRNNNQWRDGNRTNNNNYNRNNNRQNYQNNTQNNFQNSFNDDFRNSFQNDYQNNSQNQSDRSFSGNNGNSQSRGNNGYRGRNNSYNNNFNNSPNNYNRGNNYYNNNNRSNQYNNSNRNGNRQSVNHLDSSQGNDEVPQPNQQDEMPQLGDLQ